jgi:SAM-dependent methyltransferase
MSVEPFVKLRNDLDPNRRYKYQLSRNIDFEILEGSNVLDVGPETAPFPLATHRAGIDQRDDPGDGKPFFLCDLEKGVSVEDKFFDFVYCSNVLEHLDNPVKGASELGRIGKRGFIEVPSGFATIFMFYGIDHPKWFCTQDDDGTLVFTRWDKKILKYYQDNCCGAAMDRIVNGKVQSLSQNELILRDFYMQKADLFYPIQLWKTEPKVRFGNWFGKL